MSQPEPQQTPFLPVYRRAETIMIRGEGVYLFDDQGKIQAHYNKMHIFQV